MGIKGAKLTEIATEVGETIVRELSSLGTISSRKMFGGYGLFDNDVMFGMVTSEGGIFFRTSVENQRRFDECGAAQFGKMPYYSLPDSVRKNPDEVHEWARASIDVAHSLKKPR